MTPVTRRERSRQQDTRDDGAHWQRSFSPRTTEDANGAFRAFAQVFPLDGMPRVKALTELGVRRDQDAALVRKACLEAADELGAALAGLPE